MKRLLITVFILTLFNGCGQDTITLVTPKAHTIDAKTKPIPTRTFKYEKVKANTTITVKVDSAVLAWRDAVWFKAKTNRVDRNNRKLLVANKALNQQIRAINSKGGS